MRTYSTYSAAAKEARYTSTFDWFLQRPLPNRECHYARQRRVKSPTRLQEASKSLFSTQRKVSAPTI